jgi:hypothetical protein
VVSSSTVRISSGSAATLLLISVEGNDNLNLVLKNIDSVVFGNSSTTTAMTFAAPTQGWLEMDNVTVRYDSQTATADNWFTSTVTRLPDFKIRYSRFIRFGQGSDGAKNPVTLCELICVTVGDTFLRHAPPYCFGDSLVDSSPTTCGYLLTKTRSRIDSQTASMTISTPHSVSSSRSLSVSTTPSRIRLLTSRTWTMERLATGTASRRSSLTVSVSMSDATFSHTTVIPTSSSTASHDATGTQQQSTSASLSLPLPPNDAAVEAVVLPVPIQQAVAAASVASSAATAILSPGAALQLSRVTGVLQLVSRCTGSTGDAAHSLENALEFPQALLWFLKVGSTASGQYHRGAVVGNIAVITGGFVLTLLLVIVAVKILNIQPKSVSVAAATTQPRPSVVTIAGRVARFPGSFAVVSAICLDGTILAATTLTVTSEDLTSDAPYIAAGYLFCIILFAIVVWASKRCVGDGSLVFVPMLMIRTGSNVSIGAQNATSPVEVFRSRVAAKIAAFCLFGTRAWMPFPHDAVDTDSAFALSFAPAELPLALSALESWGLLVTKYRGDTAWWTGDGFANGLVSSIASRYLVVDFLLSVGIAASQAAAYRDCRTATWFALVINVVGFAFAILVRPYSVPFKNLAMGTTSFATVVGNAIVLWSIVTGDRRYTRVASTVLAAGSMIGFLTLGLGVVRLILVRAVLRSEVIVDVNELRARLAATKALQAVVSTDDDHEGYDMPLLLDTHAECASDPSSPIVTPPLVSPAPDPIEPPPSKAAPPRAVLAPRVDMGLGIGGTALVRARRSAELQRRHDELEAMLNGAHANNDASSAMDPLDALLGIMSVPTHSRTHRRHDGLDDLF